MNWLLKYSSPPWKCSVSQSVISRSRPALTPLEVFDCERPVSRKHGARKPRLPCKVQRTGRGRTGGCRFGFAGNEPREESIRMDRKAKIGLT